MTWLLGKLAGIGWRYVAEAIVIALLVGGATWALLDYGKRKFAAGDAVGAARVQQQWDREKAQQEQAARLEVEQRRKQEADTAAKQQEALNAQIKRAAQLAADRDRLLRERDGLQHRLADTVAAALGGVRADDPSAAGQRAAIGALGDTIRDCRQAYSDLAAAADVDRSAGQLCEQSYDALTEPAGDPGPGNPPEGEGGATVTVVSHHPPGS